ncbi:hypothetical protein DCAR_0100675 [Daucus carota subsp. sativus]|uniref:Uncharacterized protein n=1 Tax=Daucus carota subsp. sativus TaxID=79200 RepID=A0A166FUF9_DAUCS|nr:hypothetical protein DCAR_0100675 [Daucus carota subsp. sativus]
MALFLAPTGYRSASVTVLSDYLCAAGITFEIDTYVKFSSATMVLKQLDLLLAAYNKTVPVSRFETPTPANMNHQQLSQSTHGSSTNTLSSAHFLAQFWNHTCYTMHMIPKPDIERLGHSKLSLIT